MIIIGFIIDYIVMLLFPFNSYSIVYELDKNKIVDVIIVGIVFGLLYGKILFFFVLLGLYLFFKKLNFKKKYSWLKNMLLYLIFFDISFFVMGFELKRYLFLGIMGIFMFFLYALLNKIYK